MANRPATSPLSLDTRYWETREIAWRTRISRYKAQPKGGAVPFAAKGHSQNVSLSGLAVEV